MTTNTYSIAIIKASREPYRRAGVMLALAAYAFTVEAETPLTDIQIDPKWGVFKGDITADQLAVLKDDPNVFVEAREVEIAAAPEGRAPLSDGESLAIQGTVIAAAKPLIAADGWTPNAANRKALLEPVAAALIEAEFPADAVELGDKRKDGFDLLAVYGDQRVLVTLAPEASD